MEYFWAIFASIIPLSIIWAMIHNALKNRRLKRASRALLPELADHIQTGKRYNVFMSHGKTFTNVRFLGLTPSLNVQSSWLPFHLAEWLIMETESSKRIYIKPTAIRYYEDA